MPKDVPLEVIDVMSRLNFLAALGDPVALTQLVKELAKFAGWHPNSVAASAFRYGYERSLRAMYGLRNPRVVEFVTA